MKKDNDKAFENDALFLEVMAEALSIQDRFVAEPVYAKTGKGYLKSVGVNELQKLKDERKMILKDQVACRPHHACRTSVSFEI